MKKLLLSLLFFFTASVALATVGGPTFIDSFRYNPADESVYYALESESGRGCPPELWKISLNTGKKDVVFSCTQGEEFLRTNNNFDYNTVNATIATMIENYKPLIPISLPNNNITIDVDFVRSEKMTPEDDWILRSHFNVAVYQDGKKVGEFPVNGCNLEQPFIFAGYAIPGFDKKIMILLSTKGDCFEGGYIYETLKVVGGVDNLDKTYAGNTFKTRSALVPSEATLVVFEKDEPASVPSEDPSLKPEPATPNESFEENADKTPFSWLHLAIVALVSLIIGALSGKLIFRNPPTPINHL